MESLPLPGDSPAGWVALTGTEGGIGLGVKAFRQQYPKVKGQRCRPDPIELLTSPGLTWEAGVAKTHHLTLFFYGARERESLQYMAGITINHRWPPRPLTG